MNNFSFFKQNNISIIEEFNYKCKSGKENSNSSYWIESTLNKYILHNL